MCLMVYLGLDHNLEGFSDRVVGRVGLDPDIQTPPAALSGKRYVYGVADWYGDGWNCSCIFLSNHLDWEDATPDESESSAWKRVAEIASRALQLELNPIFFASWAGDEQLQPRLHRKLAPEQLTWERRPFNDLEMGEVPTLVNIVPTADDPVRHDP